ncbi:MAG: 50S ribosomal protein L9 [Rhodothermales bacterium]
MQVLLLEDVEKLGEAGDIVSVKNGYGRNYLIPRKLGVIATKSAMKMREEVIRQQARKRQADTDQAKEVARQLEALDLVLQAKVGEENRIFGTITPQQIAVNLATHGFAIDRRRIDIDEEIRLIGVYTATVKVHANVNAKLKFRVEPLADGLE